MARKHEALSYKEYQLLIAQRKPGTQRERHLTGLQDVRLEVRLPAPARCRAPLNPLVTVELSQEEATPVDGAGVLQDGGFGAKDVQGADIMAVQMMAGNDVRRIMESIHLAAIGQPSETQMAS